MRMWMIDPVMMCNQHLLGEHVEIHMTVGNLKRGKSIKGYLNDSVVLLEPKRIISRHNEIVNEMSRRGMKHRSPILFDLLEIENLYSHDDMEEIIMAEVDPDNSKTELCIRCDECRARIER